MIDRAVLCVLALGIAGAATANDRVPSEAIQNTDSLEVRAEQLREARASQSTVTIASTETRPVPPARGLAHNNHVSFGFGQGLNGAGSRRLADNADVANIRRVTTGRRVGQRAYDRRLGQISGAVNPTTDGAGQGSAGGQMDITQSSSDQLIDPAAAIGAFNPSFTDEAIDDGLRLTQVDSFIPGLGFDPNDFDPCTLNARNIDCDDPSRSD
ncbi:MAG: hypothetical protein HKN85_10580 [Gammaproteobacteria bacterium]|nr:hypothetical protein [Gammaproteobacteria bacterium]